MIINKINDMEVRLNNYIDFSWLKKHVRAFFVIDETGSGCICLGMEKNGNRVFIKIAGVGTIETTLSPSESKKLLLNSVEISNDIAHDNLAKVIDSYEYSDYYIVVYEWGEGECLFDHWNFEKYASNFDIISPTRKFFQLPIKKKLDTVDVLFSFLKKVADSGYVAIDFYDGSIMYDFSNNLTTLCDIDLFRKSPAVNDVGEEFHGTKRLKSPEEYVLGDMINEETNVFTLGAMIFGFFGVFSDSDIAKRYSENKFYACQIDEWQLNKLSYEVVLKATDTSRDDRYKTIEEFNREWTNSLA